MHDEVLIHITGWRDMLRYATHERNDDWNPPLVSLETAHMRARAWDFTPLAQAAYYALIGAYAGAPVLHSRGKARGNEGLPRKLTLHRAYSELRSAGLARSKHLPSALNSLIEAGLIVLATVDGRSIDGPVEGLVEGGSRSRVGRGLREVEVKDSNGHDPEFLDPAETIRVDGR